MTKIAKTGPLADTLRQMLAVLEEERQALAALDVDALTLTSKGKLACCDALAQGAPAALDSECRGLLQAAKHANEVNRRIRNLVAANVAARLDGLTGALGLYHSPTAPSRHSIAHA